MAEKRVWVQATDDEVDYVILAILREFGRRTLGELQSHFDLFEQDGYFRATWDEVKAGIARLEKEQSIGLDNDIVRMRAPGIIDYNSRKIKDKVSLPFDQLGPAPDLLITG